MLTGATDPFDEALDAQPYQYRADSDVTPQVVAVAESLLHIGAAVLLIAPGSKRPLCIAPARAQGTRHDCGVYHAITRDPRPDAAIGAQPRAGIPTLRSALVRLRRQEIDISSINLAVQPRLSRMVCVDIDHPGQLGRWTEHDLTVRTPGTTDGAHGGGGHIWLRVPEEITDDELRTWSDIRHVDGWVAKIDGYALVPPSRRETGTYEHIGAVRMWQ